MSNTTNSSRAARKLQQLTNLTYQQALDRIRSVGEIPDLTTPEAVAAFLAKTARVEANTSPGDERYYVVLIYSGGKISSDQIWTSDQLQPDMLTAIEAEPDATSWAGIGWGLGRVSEPVMSPVIYPNERYDIVINNEIGFTTDNWEVADLRPDMLKAILANPGAGRWEGVDDEGGTWDVTSEEVGAIVLDLSSVVPETSAPAPNTTPVVIWANDDGEFPLTGGGWGNPGCDCGMDDAIVKVDGEYLCMNEAAHRGYVWMCDECENPIVSNESVSDQHAGWCSLYIGNVIESFDDVADSGTTSIDVTSTAEVLESYQDAAPMNSSATAVTPRPEPVRVRVELSDGSVEQYALQREDS